MRLEVRYEVLVRVIRIYVIDTWYFKEDNKILTLLRFLSLDALLDLSSGWKT